MGDWVVGIPVFNGNRRRGTGSTVSIILANHSGLVRLVVPRWVRREDLISRTVVVREGITPEPTTAPKVEAISTRGEDNEGYGSEVDLILKSISASDHEVMESLVASPESFPGSPRFHIIPYRDDNAICSRHPTPIGTDTRMGVFSFAFGFPGLYTGDPFRPILPFASRQLQDRHLETRCPLSR